MAKTKQSKRKKVVTADDIATAGRIRVHDNGDIEILSEREAEAMVADMLNEVVAKVFARDQARRKVH